MVWTAMPPIRLPAASPRFPAAAAETVIATSGRVPATARKSRPPRSEPSPSRTSSASVVFERRTPAPQVAAAAAANTATRSSEDSPPTGRPYAAPRRDSQPRIRPLLPLFDNIPVRRFPVVTYSLIAANVTVFLWELGARGARVDHYAFYPCAVSGPCVGAARDHLVWPEGVLTSMFLHAGWAHLLGNM